MRTMTVLLVVLALLVVTAAVAAPVTDLQPLTIAPLSIHAAAPAPAADSGWETCAVVALNDGPPMGAGISHKLGANFHTDAFGKSVEGKFVGAFGVSTSLTKITEQIAAFLNVKLGAVPDGYCIGGGIETDGGKVIYAAKHWPLTLSF